MSSRILLITPEFYGVEKIIKTELEKKGFDVVWFGNMNLAFDYHGVKAKFKLLRRIYSFLLAPNTKYIKRQLSKISDQRFDILFAINGHSVCSYLFKKLKRKNPDLYSILYLWDSFSMFKWTRELRYFNRVLTFDPEDSKNYHLEYKPNFYVINNQQINSNAEYDLIFAGKFNQFRLNVIDKIISQVENSNIKYFIKLWPAYKIFPHNYLIYSLLKKINFNSNWTKNYLLNYEAIEGIIKREFLIEKNLKYEEIQSQLLCSNVILDLPYKEQTGYSHRLIEALANGKKVISTNSNIKKERFYNSEQFRFMDMKNPEVDSTWIKERKTFPIACFLHELELSAWLKSIINAEIS
jgi:hypothetical protein